MGTQLERLDDVYTLFYFYSCFSLALSNVCFFDHALQVYVALKLYACYFRCEYLIYFGLFIIIVKCCHHSGNFSKSSGKLIKFYEEGYTGKLYDLF